MRQEKLRWLALSGLLLEAGCLMAVVVGNSDAIAKAEQTRKFVFHPLTSLAGARRGTEKFLKPDTFLFFSAFTAFSAGDRFHDLFYLFMTMAESDKILSKPASVRVMSFRPCRAR